MFVHRKHAGLDVAGNIVSTYAPAFVASTTSSVDMTSLYCKLLIGHGAVGYDDDTLRILAHLSSIRCMFELYERGLAPRQHCCPFRVLARVWPSSIQAMEFASVRESFMCVVLLPASSLQEQTNELRRIVPQAHP